jgi:hypothetical protein
MATQGYGTSPGRNSGNAVGTSPSRAVATKAVPLIRQAMAKPAKPKKGKKS